MAPYSLSILHYPLIMIPKLSIVFLNYNRLNETRYTSAHLQQLITGRRDIEVIAVDNDSTDGT